MSLYAHENLFLFIRTFVHPKGASGFVDWWHKQPAGMSLPGTDRVTGVE
jgi:hypothetical protein